MRSSPDGGDLIDAGLAVASVREDPQRRRQELVATLATPCASGAGALIETPADVRIWRSRSTGFARFASGHHGYDTD
jgi:hypothetical protein